MRIADVTKKARSHVTFSWSCPLCMALCSSVIAAGEDVGGERGQVVVYGGRSKMCRRTTNKARTKPIPEVCYFKEGGSERGRGRSGLVAVVEMSCAIVITCVLTSHTWTENQSHLPTQTQYERISANAHSCPQCARHLQNQSQKGNGEKKCEVRTP